MPAPARTAAEGALENTAALALFLALAALALRPIWRVFGSEIAPDLGDPLFNLVLLKWGVHKLTTGWSGFWDAPFFFPTRGATTLSDHLLGPAAVATLLDRLGIGAIASYNLLLLGSFVLTGFNTFWVLRRTGRSRPAALVGGLAFAFAPMRWDQASHLQVLLAQWIPLVLWHFDRLLETPSVRRAALFLFFYALHTTGGTYLAYMVHVPLLTILAVRAPALRRAADRRGRALVLASGGAALLLAAAVFAPYRSAASGAIERKEFEVRQFGASLASFATPSASNLYAGGFRPAWRRPENALFPGFLPTALAAVGIAGLWPRLRRAPPPDDSAGRRRLRRGLAALALLAFLLADLRTWLATPQVKATGFLLSTPPYSTGLLIFALALAGWAWLGRGTPVDLGSFSPWHRGLAIGSAACLLLAFPLAFVPLMRFVPGLSGMRVASRFVVFASFGLAALAAYGFDRLRARRPAPASRLALAAVALPLLALELAPHPLRFAPPAPEAEVPSVVRYLARDQGVRAILELPIGAPIADLPYAYWATEHWKPMVNGYSGFIPPANAAFRAECCDPLPTRDQLARLASDGVTHVVVHRDRYPRRWQRREIDRWPRNRRVRLTYRDERTRVFRILPSASVDPP